MSQNERIHVLYAGEVQGVGFRFAAVRIAEKFDVTGFVKNMNNGNVEVMAEGKKRSLEGFLEELQEEMYACVRDTNVSWHKATGEFSEFQIRFH